MKTNLSSVSLRSRRRDASLFAVNAHGSAETLVGMGFRYWMTGFRTGDLVHWQRAFQLAAETLGARPARLLCGDFSRWVRVLNDRSRRDIQVLPPDAACYGRDECVAMAVIASYQHQVCPALQACAITLLGCQPARDIAELSGAVADHLTEADQMLPERAMEQVIRQAKPGVAIVI